MRDLSSWTLSGVVLLQAFLLGAGCVPTANPYDPETPSDGQAKARVQGRVIADSLESPERLTVDLVRQGEPAFSSTTGSEGSFSVEDVTPGRYTLEVRVTGFLPFLLPITVFAGETLKVGDVVLVPQSGAEASAIVGVVTLEGQDEGEHGGTLVEAVGRSFTAVTSSSGAFRLPVVAGSYDLRFSKASFQIASVEDIEVLAGEEKVLEAVVLGANPATLTGHVDAEGEAGGSAPLDEATVTLEGTSLTALTNGSGDFTLSGVPPGSHLLRIVKDGYVSQSATVPNVIGGETRPLGSFELSLSRGGITGTIALADSADASGVIVELTGTDRAQLTGSSGTFSFDNVLLGTYSLTARKDGYNARDLGTFTVNADVVTSTGSFTLSRKSGLVSIVEGAATNALDISLLITAPTATGYKASEDPAFLDPTLGDVEGDAFRAFVPGAAVPFTLSDQDGLHTVYVVTSDGTTTSAPASAEVVLDREPPSIDSIVIGSGAPFLASASGIVTLHLEGFDLPPAGSPGISVSGIVKMRLSNDAALTGAPALEYRTTTTHTLDAPAVEGEKAVYARFEDAAGNVSEIASAVVVLDNTAPVDVSLVLEGDSDSPSYTRSPFLTAVLFANDDNGGVSGENLLVRLSNEPGFVGATYQPFGEGLLAWLVSPGDGEKTVYAQVRDPAGNESLVVSDVLTLDTSPPSGAFVLVAGGAATTTTSSVTLTLAASGASEMAISQDAFAGGTTWEAYSPSKSDSLLAEGTVTVSAKFRDDAGWETGVVTDSILYDATPPAAGTLTLTGTLGDGRSSTTLTASNIVLADPLPAAADRDEALSMALVQSSDGACTAADFPVSPLFTPYGRTSFVLTAGDGNKTVCVIFRDAAGNFDRATARGATLRVDATAPSVPLFEDATSGLTNETSVTATVTPSTDGGGAVEHRCFGGATFGSGGVVCDPSSPIVWTLREDAENILGVGACDLAKNCVEARITVLQDATAPLTPVLKSIAANESSISLSWHASASQDAAGYAVYYGTAPGDRGSADAEQGASPIFVGDVSSFQLSGLAQGTTYYVSVGAIDEAGNVGDPSGELAATPSKASMRFVSSFGGRPRQLGVLDTRGYIAEPQGIVQVDLTKSAASDMTIGRASVPNVVPDRQGTLTVMPCTADGVVGDCVLFYGSTLEGELREDDTHFRAGVSIVYFRRGGTPDAPEEGRVLTTLPAQARAIVKDSEQSNVFYTVDTQRVTAYVLKQPSGSQTDAPFVLGSADHATPLVAVNAAGIDGEYLYVVGLPEEPNLSCQADVYACVELYASDRAALLARDATTGDALGMLVSHSGGPVTSYSPYNDLAVAFANGLNVVSIVANASDASAVDFLVAHHHADQSGLLSLTPTSSQRVVMGARGVPSPLLAVAHGSRVHMGAADEDGLQQLYSVDVAAGGALSVGPSAPRFADDPQALSALAVGDSYVFAADTAIVAEDSQLMMRWTIPASGNYSAFGSVLVPPTGTAMAYQDGVVFLGQGRNLYAFDVTNARAPTLLSAPAVNPSRVSGSYDRLRVQGHLVFASASGGTGIDIFRYDGALGSLVYLSTAGAVQYADFAVIGERLYATRRFPSAVGFDRFSLANPSAPSSIGTCDAASVVPWYVGAFAVRHDTAYLLSTNDDFRVIDIAACTQVSGDITLPSSLGSGVLRHVTVSGTRAIVSNYEKAYAVSVANPASPSYNSTLGELPLAGATSQAGGYAVGLGSYNIFSGLYQPGPRLLNPFGEIDGFLAHAPCGQRSNGFSSMTLADGMLFASCDDLGIQILSLAAPTGADIVQERAGYSYFRNNRDRLATDGNYAFLGAFDTLYEINGELWSAGYPDIFLPTPAVNTTLSADYIEGMLHVTGSVVTVNDLSPPTSARIQLRDAADVDTTWPLNSTYTLGDVDVTDTPVTSGRRLYVPVSNGTVAGTGIRQLSMNDHNSLTNVTLTTTVVDQIALSRDRLYIVAWVTDAYRLIVYRLNDNGTLAASPGNHVLELPTGFEARDLAVHGGQVLVTAEANGQSAVVLFPDPGFGTATVTTAEMRWLSSTLPLADPTVSGDVLFVAENLGVTTFDVSGTFSRARTTPKRLGSIATGDARTNNLVDLVMAGPFLYLAGDRYRVFDMR